MKDELLSVFTNGSRLSVVLEGREVPLLTFADESERAATFVKLQDRSVDLFAAATVLLWRLAQYPDVCSGLDDDQAAISATLLLVKALEEIKGRPFNLGDFK